MNAIVLDLTSNQHYIALQYDGKTYDFCFDEESIVKRNNWDEKIETIKQSVTGFEFKNLEKMAYAAGPGSYTGARLAYTFLQTLQLILERDFYAYSNLCAMNFEQTNKVAVIKGNKNDFFYRHNNQDFYCDNIDKLPDADYIGVKSDQLPLKGIVEVEAKHIAINILKMLLSENNKHLPTNYPNYIKELSYHKSR